MGRLTEKFKDGRNILKKGISDVFHVGFGRFFEGQAIDRLAEYEDFEEIFRSKMTDAACDFLSDKEEFAKWLDRNKWIAKKCDEYARAEEQGKLLKLPCAVGDTYFCIDDGSYPNEWEFVNVQQIISVMDKIGKTIFLTRKEAEAALKEL